MSSHSTSQPFTFGVRLGLTFVVQAACLSCSAVLMLLGYVAYNAFRNRGTHRWHFLRSHVDLYFLGLLLADLVQSIGGIMDIRWIAKAGVFEGHFCTAQGALKQLGDVGVALCSLAIAIHTFAVLFLRWKEPASSALPIVVLCLYGVFLAFIVGIGYSVHRNQVYYGNTTYWCWIRRDFLAEGIGLEYLWLWIAAFTNLILYVPLFLALKRIIIVEPTKAWLGWRVRISTRAERQAPIAEQEDATVNARQMLYYPAVYIVTVLPIAVVRFHTFVSSTVPFPATVFSAITFSASGLLNVLLFTITRPALLRPPPSPTMSLSDLEQRGGGNSTPRISGERNLARQLRPRLADSAFEMDDTSLIGQGVSGHAYDDSAASSVGKALPRLPNAVYT